MKNNSLLIRDRACLFAATAVLTTLGFSGCVYPESEQHYGHQGYPVAQPQAVVMVQDDYIYYPQYEVYYSSSRHQYGYPEGNAWAWRPAPPQVSLNVLVASPSVRMDFHDSPDRHHSSVVKQYPKNWKQSSDNHGGKNGKGNDQKDDRSNGNQGH